MYHIILITKRTPVALVGGHYIYHAEATQMKQVSASSSTNTALEDARKKTFANIDLNKNFYFSSVTFSRGLLFQCLVLTA